MTQQTIAGFREWLRGKERAVATVDKYVREASVFAEWLSGNAPTLAAAVAYKAHLAQTCKVTRVNGAVAALNAYFDYAKTDVKLQSLRTQARTFLPAECELSYSDYRKMLDAAEAGSRCSLMLMTLAATGIRVSELRHVTVEAVHMRTLEITNKGKVRRVPLPFKLTERLSAYAAQCGIASGTIFRSVRGNALDRKDVWRDLKRLALAAGVNADKVYPHNLRKLFARCYYAQDRDIARLADVLGHSSVNTTRIYVADTVDSVRLTMDALGFV